MDSEKLYQLLHQERWLAVLEFIYEHHTTIASDPIAQHAIRTFEAAFLRRLDAQEGDDVAEVLEKIVMLRSGRLYEPEPVLFEQAVARLVTLKQAAGELRAAYSYARQCPDNETCAAVLDQYVPEEPTGNAIDPVAVRHNEPQAADHRIPLFKSRQEYAFFMALRETFPRYDVVPNVALSCLVDFGALKQHLSAEERTFFFRGIVDCVVYDQLSDYLPLYFFELDSAFHDTEAQRQNDAHKDRILALAGQRLYRIRMPASQTSRHAFAQLIWKIMRDRCPE